MTEQTDRDVMVECLIARDAEIIALRRAAWKVVNSRDGRDGLSQAIDELRATLWESSNE